jgi:hypothetical protein
MSVEQHGLAVARRFRDANVPGDHRLVHLVAEEAAHVRRHEVGEALLRLSNIVSTMPCSAREGLKPRPDHLDGAHDLADAFEGEELALERDEYRIGRDQGR